MFYIVVGLILWQSISLFVNDLRLRTTIKMPYMFHHIQLEIETLGFEWTNVLFISDGRVQKVLLLLCTVFTGQTLSRAKFFRADAKTRQVIPSRQRLKTPSCGNFLPLSCS